MMTVEVMARRFVWSVESVERSNCCRKVSSCQLDPKANLEYNASSVALQSAAPCMGPQWYGRVFE